MLEQHHDAGCACGHIARDALDIIPRQPKVVIRECDRASLRASLRALLTISAIAQQPANDRAHLGALIRREVTRTERDNGSVLLLLYGERIEHSNRARVARGKQL